MPAKQSTTLTKQLGAILLIVGTSVGGGMLALPIATAALGFIPSAIYLFIIWSCMSIGALLTMEVNAWLPLNSNLISMAGATIGKRGQAITWFSYMFLLYCLIAAYIAGGQDVISTLLSYINLHPTEKLAAIIFLIIFGLVVFFGIRSVDLVNRIIMAVKIFTYFSIVFFTAPFINLNYLTLTPLNFSVTISTLMIIVTSYGFSIIIPSLRTYFNDDFVSLRRCVFIGSSIPLLLYLIWEAIIFTVLPKFGAYSLNELAQSSQPIATLMQTLGHLSQQYLIISIANIFTSVCIITAFLGVSLCLVDFLADGLRLRKTGKSSIIIYVLTFVPPLLMALFAKKAFVNGLSLAGIFCVILLMLLPALMTWSGRYKKNMPYQYRVFGGKPLLIGMMIISCGLLIALLVQRF